MRGVCWELPGRKQRVDHLDARKEEARLVDFGFDLEGYPDNLVGEVGVGEVKEVYVLAIDRDNSEGQASNLFVKWFIAGFVRDESSDLEPRSRVRWVCALGYPGLLRKNRELVGGER